MATTSERRRRTLGIALLALAPLLSGCGGPSTRELMNRREFEALLTAVSLRNKTELEADSKRIDARRSSGELSEEAHQRFKRSSPKPAPAIGPGPRNKRMSSESERRIFVKAREQRFFVSARREGLLATGEQNRFRPARRRFPWRDRRESRRLTLPKILDPISWKSCLPAKSLAKSHHRSVSELSRERSIEVAVS